MSLRCLFIFTDQKGNSALIFSRKFPTVEKLCARNNKFYVPIPNVEELTDLVLTEIFYKHEESFVPSRDGCSVSECLPAIKLHSKNGIIYPVVITKSSGYTFCAIPMIDGNDSKSFCEMSAISVALDVLHSFESFVTKSEFLKNLNSSAALAELRGYINVSLPFGKPVFSSPMNTSLLNNFSQKLKPKQQKPNFVSQKGKNQILIQVKEEIYCLQYKDMVDMEVSGTIAFEAGLSPEISLQLFQPHCSNLSVHPSVYQVEEKGFSTTLWLNSTKESLIYYSVPSLTIPPIKGELSGKVNGSLVVINLDLYIDKYVQMPFSLLEIQIPFTGYTLNGNKSNCSMGSVTSHGSNLVWNVGSKVSSRNNHLLLKAQIKLNKVSDSRLEDNLYAEIFFKVPDFTYSKTQINPQSIIVSTTSKPKISISYELVSRKYKIWNKEGNCPYYNFLLAKARS